MRPKNDWVCVHDSFFCDLVFFLSLSLLLVKPFFFKKILWLHNFELFLEKEREKKV